MTIRTVPFKCVHRILRRARYFHHHAERTCSALRRMPHMLRQQENLPFTNRNFQRWFSRRLHNPQNDIALQLIEKFLRRIVMEIPPRIRPAHNGHHHLAIFPNLRVTHRRLELLFVLVNPRLKIKRLQVLYRWHSTLPKILRSAPSQSCHPEAPRFSSGARDLYRHSARPMAPVYTPLPESQSTNADAATDAPRQ